MAPFEVDATTGEPFLRLPVPHTNIILTPSRASDKDATVPLLNNPIIISQLSGPPFPYLEEHAISWLKQKADEADSILAEIQPLSDEAPSVVSGCPFSSIREVLEDGSNVFLGDISIRRCDWQHLPKDEREQLVKDNDAKPAGDHTIVWTIGDYLSPNHHGRGIMTSAVQTVLWKWAVPMMAVRHMIGSAFEENIGSVRVFAKSGFEEVALIKDCQNCRGAMKSVHVLEWKYPAGKPSWSS